jgi:hypothetical protein
VNVAISTLVPRPASPTAASCQTRANRVLAELISAQGGIMVLAKPCLQIQVLGHLAWLGDQRVFWVGISPQGQGVPHVIQYDLMCRVAHRGVVLFSGEEIVAYLCTIGTVSSEMRGNFAAEFRSWKKQLPKRTTEICSWCQAESATSPRVCAWHLPQCRRGESSAESLGSRDERPRVES